MATVAGIIQMTLRWRWCTCGDAAALLLLTGCVATPPAPVVDRTGPGHESSASIRNVTPPPVTASVPRLAPEEPAAPESRSVGFVRNPAVVALTTAADAEINAGRFPIAGAKIDRALRIDPKDPWVWHGLARVQFASGELAQAAATARRP